MKCIICKTSEGTSVIKDATQFPKRYNDKPICDSCQADRERLRD